MRFVGDHIKLPITDVLAKPALSFGLEPSSATSLSSFPRLVTVEMNIKVVSNKATGTVAFMEASQEFLGVLRDLKSIDLTVLALILEPPRQPQETREGPGQPVTPLEHFLSETGSLWCDAEPTPKSLQASDLRVLLLEKLNPGPYLKKLLASLLGLIPPHVKECQGFKLCGKLCELELSPLIPSTVTTCPVCKHWMNKSMACNMVPASFIPSYLGQTMLDASRPIFNCFTPGCNVFSNTGGIECPTCAHAPSLLLNGTIVDKVGDTKEPVGSLPPRSLSGAAFYFSTFPILVLAEDGRMVPEYWKAFKRDLPATLDKSKLIFTCSKCTYFFSNSRNVPCTRCNLPEAKARWVCTTLTLGSDGGEEFRLLVEGPSEDEASRKWTKNLKEQKFIVTDALDVENGYACVEGLRVNAGIFDAEGSSTKVVSIGTKKDARESSLKRSEIHKRIEGNREREGNNSSWPKN